MLMGLLSVVRSAAGCWTSTYNVARAPANPAPALLRPEAPLDPSRRGCVINRVVNTVLCAGYDPDPY